MLDKRKDLVILLFLICLAFTIRFSLISKGFFHKDTLELAQNAQNTLKTYKLHYMHGPGYPLTVIVASIFIFLMRFIGINDQIFSVNFMSVVFGSLDIGVFYLFSRKILDRTGALFSSFIFCFLPLYVSISTYGMTHPISIFFNLTSIYFLFLYLERNKLNMLIFSAIFLGLGFAARFSDGLVITAVIFLYLMHSFKNFQFSKKAIIYRLILFLILYSIIILFFYFPMFIKIGLSSFKDTATTYYYGHSLQNLYASGARLIEILGEFGMIILIVGMIYFFFKKDRIIFFFLLIWFFSIFIFIGSTTTVASRHLSLSFIPLLVLQGNFISEIFNFKVSKPFKVFIIFLSSIFIIYNFAIFYPVAKFRHEYDLQKYFGNFIQNNTEPESLIVTMDEGPFIEYYARRKILYKAIGINKSDFDEFFRQLDVLLDKEVPIYIISSAFYAYDPKGYFRKKLFNNYYLKYIDNHLYEGWNFIEIEYGLFMQRLYKIKKRL